MKQKTKEEEKSMYPMGQGKVSECNVRKVKCAKRIKYETFRKNGW